MDSQRSPVLIWRSDMRILVLGGTTEASALARLLAGDKRFEATLSLAGRTANPRPQPIATRIGGFGGADGLAQFLAAEKIEAVIDATHPYADQISANAVAACKTTSVPLVSIVRPQWQPMAGDKWLEARDTADAAHLLGPKPSRVFLSLGRQDLHFFATAPQHHYIARLIEAPQHANLPPDLRLIQSRGPFDFTAEYRLLAEEKIDVLVSKNSGGDATYPKLAAARTLGLPVIMIARPNKRAGHMVGSPEAALAHLSLRGV